MPLKGYLYRKGEGMFTEFVESIYSKRAQAKKEGKTGLSLVLKLIMNALYGRFGINPMSTVTDIVNFEEFHKINPEIITSYYPVTKNRVVVTYWKIPNELDKDWYPKLAAVQISAAIAACSRIHMNPYASRDDCHYTDTDSVVLKDPLPPDKVCNYTLGK